VHGLPFTKAHAVGNDFLVVESADLGGLSDEEIARLAVGACDRHAGVGADGLEVLFPPRPDDDADFYIRIFNSDGSEAEISGNGTRCVAADLIDRGRAGDRMRIATAAGVKTLERTGREGSTFQFRMGMGRPAHREDEIRTRIDVGGQPVTATLVDVGNPQCAVRVDDFELDWRRLGAALERHPRFPMRTNVSFFRVVDENTLDVRFWERGAGETASSGTGSTGAATAGILEGVVRSPVRIRTPAGDMTVGWDGEAWLDGPAVLIARGRLL